MITIRDLKENGKERIRNCYLLALVVCIIIAFFNGGFGSYNSRSYEDNFDGFYEKYIDDKDDRSYETYEENTAYNERINSNEYSKTKDENKINYTFIIGIIVGVFVVVLFAILVGILISTFVGSIFLIGECTFFLNAKDKPEISDILSNFKNGKYINSVKIMFLMNIKLFLWTLLFIIPGIIKAYEYAMIPYILSENPNITSDEAFAKSKEMMDGYKWFLFTLHLSFIGWYILGSLFFGFGVIFVEPWVQATVCEFYLFRKYSNPQYNYNYINSDQQYPNDQQQYYGTQENNYETQYIQDLGYHSSEDTDIIEEKDNLDIEKQNDSNQQKDS